MEELPDISQCPGGDILKCRFSYKPDYTPVIVFIVSTIVIFVLSKLLEVFNSTVFEKKKNLSIKAVESDEAPFCCMRCRRKKHGDSIEENSKLARITPQNLANFRDMKQIKEMEQDDALNYTDEDIKPETKKTTEIKTQTLLVPGEKTPKRKTTK